ncbi:putative ATP-dependent DNA ligase YkoU [compost metagenome]
MIIDRRNKIYIDYVQHAAGKSLSAPYTPRAREHATVSTPLLWEEVRAGIDPKDFNLLTTQERLHKFGDLIAKTPKQSLDAVIAFVK